MPEVSVKGGQVEAKGYTKGGEEKAKGGEGVTTQEQINMILEYLENWYTGARMQDDLELMIRVERAIAVMTTPASEDVFLSEFEKQYLERQVAEALKDADKP